MRKLFDLQHPFFRKPWRRTATLVLCFGWGMLETYWGNGFWAVLFLSLGAYCFYEFRFGPPPREPEEKKDE